MKRTKGSGWGHRGEGAIIGHAVSLTNPRFGLQCVGSPREVVEEIRDRGLNPRAAIADPETGISAAEVFKDGPELAFPGGPGAETIIELLEAIRKDNSDEVASLLRGAPDLLPSRHVGSSVALTAALVAGSEVIVKLLLSRGADPNGTTQFDMTALHWAAALGETQSAMALLGAGADAERLSWFYVTAYELATLNRRQATERAMADRLGGRSTEYSLDTVIARMSK